MMQVIEVVSHLDAVTAQAFLERLPKHIQDAFYNRADEIGYPIEAVLESAIAASLDPDSLSFLDCKPS